MIANNFAVLQNKQSFRTDNNFINSQNCKIENDKSFKDIMNEYFEDCGMKTANIARQPGSYNAEFKQNVTEVSKSSACVSPEMQKKIESALRWLANYLGIKFSFLLAVFSELGIDPNDMADQMKFAEIIEKLAEHFNLNEEQKKEIAEKMSGILGFSFG